MVNSENTTTKEVRPNSSNNSIFSRIRNNFNGNQADPTYLVNPSRRSFLRGAAGVAATFALGSAASPHTGQPDNPNEAATTAPAQTVEPPVAAGETVEPEKSVTPLILDIFNAPAFFDKVIAEQSQTTGVDAQTVLNKFGVTEDWTFFDFKNATPENEAESTILLLTALKSHYASHGENVDAVRAHTARFLNTPDVQAKHGSIEEAFGFDSIETDELGNPTLWLRVSPEIFDQLLAQSNQSVVNMSIQLGKVGIKYELYKQVRMNPDIEYPTKSQRRIGDNVAATYFDGENNQISKEEYDELERLASEKKVVLGENPTDRDLLMQDGYIKERAYDNLKLMVELATKYPDKILVVAAGNPGATVATFPDLREARAKLDEEGLWPPNLFTVGYVDEGQDGYQGPAEYGADFYVWYKDIQLISDEDPASSYATPMVTEIVRHLQSLGLRDPKDIRKALTGMSIDINTPDHKTYIKGNDSRPYYMIDFGKVKRAFQIPIEPDELRVE
ncbi:MAG: hypothetical protein COY81_04305 [Candidatus Pacebacteria bacterium CG_4_10_14_0_8_um_filter_43_12]|nr:MAG: hypothetical protein COU66_03050 [Candidatus Pacebacteria bacterium CG10_big_fil_rev_8_21_14_0_10_44_11]PIY79107.1 MAG: hypothetical protein COY81_04305 [Candidatus Pacebacteria bacterium CG_4_10_14_0_8_um_filter_43_12]